MFPEDLEIVKRGEKYLIRLRERDGKVDIFVHHIRHEDGKAFELLPNGYMLGSNSLTFELKK